MRKMLATAVALAPLALACGAQAEVVVSTGRTTPITTATAGTGGTADDVRLASGGSVTLTSGVAITLNSNNILDMDQGSTIVMDKAADGATGIQVVGGITGQLDFGGLISITDDLTSAEDTDKDGDLDGEFATGTGRYGIRFTGPDPFTGNFTADTGSAITVQGNQSYGVSIESAIIGNIYSQAAVVVTGTDSYGYRVAGDVDGKVRVGGNVSVLGGGATGAAFEGDITGALTWEGNLTATGYRYTSRPISEDVRSKLDADDLLQGGSALHVAGNVAGGVLLNSRPKFDSNNPTVLDQDGDGVDDAKEDNSAITVYGGAPAVLIASDARDIALGAYGIDDEAYGFINRGTITADGVFDGIATTAVQIGGLGYAVDVEGGFRNQSSITARSYDADAVGVRFADGAIVPTFNTSGSITAITTGDTTNSATAVLVQSGSTMGSITNSGDILVGVVGENLTGYGIRDESGLVTSITNAGLIQVSGTSGDADVAFAGDLIAIDMTANTTGVTITQLGINDGDDDGNADTTDPDEDGDGVDDADEPLIVGEIRLGSGADTVDIQNGQVDGDISFGDGADSLLISGGARVNSALSDTDGLLDITVSNGILDARQTGAIDVTSLNVGANGNLIVTIDPASSSAGGFNVNGAATFADGAGLGVRFNSLLQSDSQRFTIVNADSLTYGAIDTASLDENSPYLFVATAGADIAAGDVYVDVRRRTADEIGMIGSETAAFNSIYNAFDDDEALLALFLGQTDREDFMNLYQQMLPDHSGGSLSSLATGVDAVTRALVGRNQTAAKGETSAWLQEINFYAEKDTDQAYGFEAEGFGVAGGVERGTENGALGFSFAFTSSDLEDPESQAEEVLSANLLELGVYWRAQGEQWTTWARAAAGYAYFDSTRQLVGPGILRRAEADWNGFTATIAGGISYEGQLGDGWYYRPEFMAEYFMLHEGNRREEGGGNGFDLEIDERDGSMLTATAAVSIGKTFGKDGWMRPELKIGYRHNLSFDAGETIARFVSGGSDFTLNGDAIEGGGPIVGLRLNIGNELGMLSLEADAEMIDDYVRYALLLRASFRF